LSTTALAELAEIQLGGVPSPDLVQLLETRSEGNPYFADQFLSYLQEEKLLEMSDKGWRVIKRLQEASLPADIRALLIARLDQLTRNVREVIQTAAVLGREFEIQVLAEMLQRDELLSEEIAEAERAEIWSAISQIKYIFTHGLLRDAAYAMQMNARRMELHAVALNALEKIYAGDIEHHYAELAYHAEHARIRDKALLYLREAGMASVRAYQNSQAADYFTRALEFVSLDDLKTRYELVLERVEMYERMAKRDLHLKDLQLLEQWAQHLSDPILLAKAFMLRTRYHHIMGDWSIAATYAERTEQYLDENSMPDIAIRMLLSYFSVLFKLGMSDKAVEQAERALDIAIRSKRRIDEAKVLTAMGLAYLEYKDASIAHQHLENAVMIAREIKDRRLESYALNNLAVSYGAFKGNYALAGECYEQVYILSKEVGDRYQECAALVNIGFNASMQGELEKAYDYYQKVLLSAREIAHMYLETYILVNLSATACVQINSFSALDYARQASVLSQKLNDRSAEAWAYYYLGRAHLLLEENSTACENFIKSIDIRSDLNQTSLAMEPLAGLIEASLLIRDSAQASLAAEKILRHFENGGTLEGTDEPLRVYNVCYQFLSKQRDPRAQQILHSAKQLLDAQVSKFSDEETRRKFVENFPWRKAIRDANSD
jgi:predicted ATPase